MAPPVIDFLAKTSGAKKTAATLSKKKSPRMDG
jgi:hypothetical protein